MDSLKSKADRIRELSDEELVNVFELYKVTLNRLLGINFKVEAPPQPLKPAE